MRLETDRLVIRPLAASDAAFILLLLNDEGFLRYIGDRGVHSLDDALDYLERGPLASYARHGFGLNAVELRATGETIGICGLLKRDEFDAPDLGFAFLAPFCGRGYGYEAATAVLEQAARTVDYDRVLAITQPDNVRSIALLERLGFSFERTQTSPPQREMRIYARPL